MSSNNATPIDDVGYFIGWECAPVRFGDLRQIGRISLQGFGKSPITVPINAVTGHAGYFIFDNSQMRVVGFRFHAFLHMGTDRAHRQRGVIVPSIAAPSEPGSVRFLIPIKVKPLCNGHNLKRL
jgi:hypothetical protein